MNIRIDYKEDIICPYCFAHFSHKDVHFRMETYFSEDQLNEEGYSEEELKSMPDSEERTELLTQTNMRKPFLVKDDEVYKKWWSTYGESSEYASGVDSRLSFPVYQLPVVIPGNPASPMALRVQHPEASGKEQFLIYDADGMAAAVVDAFGKETRRRLCPHCHNPLPIHYGKNEVKFLSVIGVTGSGKTVYISQILRHMARYTSYVNMAANPTTDHEETFIENNPVLLDKPLPMASVEGRFSQPMFFDLQRSTGANSLTTNTIVIYDIAGEDCQNGQAMAKYGKFVEQSDGIMLLVDPTQLELPGSGENIDEAKAAAPQTVLTTIHNNFLNLKNDEKCSKPLAVCVSKSDAYSRFLPEIASEDVKPVIDENTGDNMSKFNASEYNVIQPEIKKMVKDFLFTNLRVGFSNYNFFVFSATGCPVEMRTGENDGVPHSYLTAPPAPKRIAEPLLWLFYRFGYITTDVPILLPEARAIPKRGRIKRLIGKDIIMLWDDMTEKERSKAEEVKPTPEELEEAKYEKL